MMGQKYESGWKFKVESGEEASSETSPHSETSQAKSDKEGASDEESGQCLTNLFAIGRAALYWADWKHTNCLPPNLLCCSNLIKSCLKYQNPPKEDSMFWPRQVPLVCPRDKANFAATAAKWAKAQEIDWARCTSYEYLTPGMAIEDAGSKVAVRCKFHGHVCYGDGRVQKVTGSQFVDVDFPPSDWVADQYLSEEVREKRQRKECRLNLQFLGLAIRMWSNYHQDKFPPDTISASISASNQNFSPKIFTCPGDRTKSPARSWATFDAAKVTYSYNPQADEMKPQTIAWRCSIHGWVCRADGSVGKEE